MVSISNLLSSKKNDFLYEAAMSGANAMASILSLESEGEIKVELDKNIFHKIFPNDPASPAIHWIDDNQYLIFYPANSKPYSHKFKDKCKFIECLSGVLYDANSNLKLFKGDFLKVDPKDHYAPYTGDQECYLRVCIGDCNMNKEQVCK